jgi:hypothetical protein
VRSKALRLERRYRLKPFVSTDFREFEHQLSLVAL